MCLCFFFLLEPSKGQSPRHLRVAYLIKCDSLSYSLSIEFNPYLSQDTIILDTAYVQNLYLYSPNISIAQHTVGIHVYTIICHPMCGA